MTFSLKQRIGLLWGILLLLLLGVGIMVYGLFQTSVQAQVSESTARLEQANAELVHRYELYRGTYPSGMDLLDKTVQTELGLIDNLVLQNYAGVEGGLWHDNQGSIIYAFPTHEGDTPKKDVPATELDRITEIVHQAQQARGSKTLVYPGNLDTLILHANWISGQPNDVIAWTMCRVHTDESQGYERYLISLLLLTAAALGSGLWLMASLRRWSERLGAVEKCLASSSSENISDLPLTGEKELDRLIITLNQTATRLNASREKSEQLSRELSRAERLAGLGRMAAGFAHEIGNPIAAMRLRLDNARDQDAARQRTALLAVEDQVKRLEELLQRLFFLGKVSEIKVQTVKVRSMLEQIVEHLRPEAQLKAVGLDLEVDPPDLSGRLDQAVLGRAIENLVLNAIQHSPSGAPVRLRAHHDERSLFFTVIDQGTGIPAEQRERIFEPFVSHRPMGMGLGLSLVAEAAAAHKGRIYLQKKSDTEPGAIFILEIPWLKS